MSFSNLKIWPVLPFTVRGRPIILSTDPKGKKIVYAHGNSVVIVDIEDPSISDVYTEHSARVTAAKYSPSGFYICSGDEHGKVRIWDTVNTTHIIKAEYHCLGGAIRDLVWSIDSKRICVVGEGKEKCAHVFMIDTGASVKGDLTGHTRCINSCDWKPTLPYRIATGGEDKKVAFHEGPPFQFKCTKGEHTRFVQCVRYSPNGDMFASGAADGRVVIYNGKTADVIKQLIAQQLEPLPHKGAFEQEKNTAHRGGIYGISWSPDSKQLLTAGADRSCKVWNVGTGLVAIEYYVGAELENQQVACIWTPAGQLISVSLSGFINYFDIASPGKPSKIIKGHNKPITQIFLTPDKKTLYSGANDGTVIAWDVATGTNDRIDGNGHRSKVTGFAYRENTIYTIGLDDALQAIDPVQKTYTSINMRICSQPNQIEPFDDGLAIINLQEILIVKNEIKYFSLPISFEGECIDVTKGETPYVAVGGDDQMVHVYSLEGKNLRLLLVLDHRGTITDVQFSPCGKYLAASDTDRKVVVYTVPGFQQYNKFEWGFHNARINCIRWSPDSQIVASGSLDTSIILWSMVDHKKHIIIRNSHPQSHVVGLAWLDNETFLSAGHDSLIKTWTAKF